MNSVSRQRSSEDITERTKLLVLPYPNNPTGAVMRKEHLEEIAAVVRRHNILVLSDEILQRADFTATVRTSPSPPLTACASAPWWSTAFKSYAMTGWRLGYALGPAELIGAMTKLHQYAIMSAPTTAQYAAIEAMRNGDEDIESMREQYAICAAAWWSTASGPSASIALSRKGLYVFSLHQKAPGFPRPISAKTHLRRACRRGARKRFRRLRCEGFVRVSTSFGQTHHRGAFPHRTLCQSL